jgi:hypothetical protein
MAHYDRAALPDSMTILAAGVGEHMVRIAGECADGFVGHTIASASYLRDVARPLLAEGAARTERDAARLRITTQIVAAASAEPRAARRDAAAQVGFYCTPKGYDLLFPDGQFAAERAAAREALARGDVPGVIAAGDAMVEERAVFGTPEDVAGQLRRYADVIDWAILYPPHFGVDPERIHANELSLIEVASAWTPLRTQPKRVQVVTLDLIDPGQQDADIVGDAEMAAGQPGRVAAGQREDQAGRLLPARPDGRSGIGEPDAQQPAEASASAAHQRDHAVEGTRTSACARRRGRRRDRFSFHDHRHRSRPGSPRWRHARRAAGEGSCPPGTWGCCR